jgi:signal transduction histidine kinase
MARFRQRPRVSFFWQPLLILFPVLVLAILGFLSLRQDKTFAQHEAIERAQTVADSLLPNLWSTLTNADNPHAFEHHAFQIDNSGDLSIPSPLALTPPPDPLNLGELNPEQASLWQRAQFAKVSNNIPGTIQTIRDFLETKPPERFAAIGDYDLSSFFIKQGELQKATDLCFSLLDKYPDAVSENGFPLDRLAEFKLLELSTKTNPVPFKVPFSADDFCRRIIFDPSPLTSPFLSWISAHAEALGLKDGNEYWNNIWNEHEESRQLYRSARSNLILEASASSASQSGPSSQFFWFNDAGENYLAIRFDEVPGIASENAFFTRNARWKGGKGKMELRPEPGKNYLASPNPSHNEPAGLRTQSSGKSYYGGGYPQRNVNSFEFSSPPLSTDQTQSGKVTLDNEPARIDSSRSAKPIITRGTAERNGMSLPDFSGPAMNQKTAATNPWILCRTESEISRTLFSLPGAKAQVPEYFGIAIEVAGKRLQEAAPDLRIWRETSFFESGDKGRKIYFPTTATNVLASASYSQNGSEVLRVSVYLTSPATLFQRQSDRTFLFGSLVAISALAAFIGLFSAWRTFNRQQELAEMKSNFVSSVSHELRAPIASVRLMAESLECGKVAEPPRQHEYFRFIGQECRRLSSLIENVLDFSRIEEGRKQYEFEPTDLLALVQQTVKLMEAYGAERQVSIVLKLPDHQLSTFDYQLSLDGRAIQQALINLLDNAIKHSPNGQTVSVVLESIDSTLSSHASRITHHVKISVIDHGPGIPSEEHEKIFERFYRLGSELRRETQGVGIGLSIVKHIVEAHHGRVLVQSVPGQGSRFTIELPTDNPKKSTGEQF